MKAFVSFVVLPGMVASFALSLITFSRYDEGPAGDGKAIYENRCISCHQLDGKGIPGVFPPLIGTKWVLGDADRLASVVLHGLMGEISIEGVTYNGAMPAWGSLLSDDELAAVLTYVRSSWGNEAPGVSPQDVTRVRAATAARTSPWNPGELEAAFESNQEARDRAEHR